MTAAVPATPNPGAHRRWERVDGVLLLDKPQGMTSNGALQAVRRLYAAEKAGHGGTLDPMASGLLVVCFGEATKFSSWLLESDKTYAGEIQLGIRTDTADADGQVVAEAPLPAAGTDWTALASRFNGTIRQRPPAFSALKRDGRPLYDYARAGIPVEAEIREVTISSLVIEPAASGRLRFEVRASRGTYVRALAEDLAAAAGTLGHLSALRRTASGPFAIESALTPEALAGFSPAERLNALRPPDVLPYGLGRLDLGPAEAGALCHGQPVELRGSTLPGRYRTYAPDGRFLGVAELAAGGRLTAVRLMAARPGEAAPGAV